MKKILIAMIMGLALAAQAQTWSSPTAPVNVTIDRLRVDFIGLSISTNMRAGGIISVSKMSGSNAVSRQTIPLSPIAITNILTNCGGITLQQLGNLLLVASGSTNGVEFINRVEVFVDPRTGKGRMNVNTLNGSKKEPMDEDKVDIVFKKAGGSVAIFKAAFLDFAKKNVK